MVCIKTKNKKVIAAARDIAFLLEDKRFWDEIYNLGFIEGTESTGPELVRYMKSVLALEDVIIYTYKRMCWIDELAVYKKSKPNSVGLNTNKLRRHKDPDLNHASIVGSGVHEIVHLVDAFIEDAEFGHPKNKTINRKFTAPYLIGKIAKNLILRHY